MTNPRLSFFKLTVPNAVAAEKFYTSAFGMTRQNIVDTKDFKEIMLISPDGAFTLVMFEWKDGREIVIGNGYGPLGFVTRDLETTIGTGRRRGRSCQRQDHRLRHSAHHVHDQSRGACAGIDRIRCEVSACRAERFRLTDQAWPCVVRAGD